MAGTKYPQNFQKIIKKATHHTNVMTRGLKFKHETEAVMALYKAYIGYAEDDEIIKDHLFLDKVFSLFLCHMPFDHCGNFPPGALTQFQ